MAAKRTNDSEPKNLVPNKFGVEKVNGRSIRALPAPLPSSRARSTPTPSRKKVTG